MKDFLAPANGRYTGTDSRDSTAHTKSSKVVVRRHHHGEDFEKRQSTLLEEDLPSFSKVYI